MRFLYIPNIFFDDGKKDGLIPHIGKKDGKKDEKKDEKKDGKKDGKRMEKG